MAATTLFVVAAVLVNGRGAVAAEGATNFYLLGLRGPGSAITPPPGIFLENDFFIYDGNAQASRSFLKNGRLLADLQARAYVNLLSVLWVTPADIAGGHLAFTITGLYGGPDIKAGAGALVPQLNIGVGRTLHDSASFFGDPVVGSYLGWSAGNFHWQFGTSVNVPIGYYDKVGFANISFHRWAADLYGNATWFNPQLGVDLSGTAGFTFNGANPYTHYRTGNEFHLELSASKNLTQELSVGVLGYYYQQVTGDSGTGAILGPFEGRVAALGGTIGYNFKIGEIPVATRVKVFRELDVQNRLKGTAGFLSIAFPLWVQSH
jgi:hypothetical protein